MNMKAIWSPFSSVRAMNTSLKFAGWHDSVGVGVTRRMMEKRKRALFAFLLGRIVGKNFILEEVHKREEGSS